MHNFNFDGLKHYNANKISANINHEHLTFKNKNKNLQPPRIKTFNVQKQEEEPLTLEFYK
jgi:hypothetical protein